MVKYCPRCGYPNPDNADFCIRCGYPLTPPNQPPPSKPSSQPSSRPSKKVLIPIIAVVVIAIVLVGSFIGIIPIPLFHHSVSVITPSTTTSSITPVKTTTQTTTSSTSTTPISNVSYIELQITNTQNIPTVAPFQQMVNLSISQIGSSMFNAIADNPLDVLFYEPNVGKLYAWLENVTPTYMIWWVKLPLGIPASSSITVYMNLTGENQYPYTGLDPLLDYKYGLSYGEFDNGQEVFIAYWNFAGTSAPPGITVYVSDGRVIFNNGVTIIGGTNATKGENGIVTTKTFSPPIVIDYIGTQTTSPPNDSWAWNMVGFSNCVGSTSPFPSWYEGVGNYTLIDFEGSPSGKNITGAESGYPETNQGGIVYTGNIPAPSSSPYVYPLGVWTQEYLPNGYYTYYDYGKYSTGYIVGGVNTLSLPFEIMVGNNEASYAPHGMTVYVLRARAYPPNGVMPIVSVLNVFTASNDPPTIAISNINFTIVPVAIVSPVVSFIPLLKRK